MFTPSIPKPTVGRIVLVTVADRTEREITIPAIVTHVHSDRCISVVAFSAFADAGVGPDGTKPMSSIEHGTGPNRWRWMDYQLGQAAKTEAAEKPLAERLGLMEAAMAQAMKRQGELEATLAALNAKQPERQRLPVADPTPVVPGIPPGADPAPEVAKLADEQPANADGSDNAGRPVDEFTDPHGEHEPKA